MDFVWLFIAALLILVTFLIMRNRMTGIENAALLDMMRQLRGQNQALKAAAGESQSMRDLLAETMIDPVFFVDAERHITYCNSAARRLSKGEAEPGRSLMEAVRSYELDSIVEETLNDKHELPREITIHERLFHTRAAVSSYNGTRTGAVVILRDVSELQRLGRARRDFVANISHELRTPLTTIKLLVDTLRANGSGDAEQHAKLLGQISTQADALTQLAQEMYDLSQMESGQIPMRMVRTPLRTLASDVLERLAPQAERVGTTLVNEIDADVFALVDPEQVRRVFTNLLHNAIKFAPQGRVTVYVAQNTLPAANGEPAEQDDFITVAVRDSGMGIARADLPRIFERFYKANRARGQGGTGLGLAIAKHIVEAHGGRIWVESIEGQGATFYFTVPKEG
jgi:two-component system phosphate regulon sensor histidine kinase PhoR